MAKLVANKYYTKNGGEKINGYFASISKKILEKSGINPEAQIKITADKKRIIIEEEK